MIRLYLVRHGENPANLTKEFSYRKVDYPLTKKGQLQARQTGYFFLNKNIDAIYSSPLKRAVESAEIIAEILNLPFIIDENFREVNVGQLEELPVNPDNWKLHNEIIKSWIDGDQERSFPGGENHRSLSQRMQTGLGSVLKGRVDQNVIIVGHGALFTLTLKDICPDVDTAFLISAENHNCSISEVYIMNFEGHWHGKLIQWAFTGHLTGDAAKLVSGIPNYLRFQSTNQQ